VTGDDNGLSESGPGPRQELYRVLVDIGHARPRVLARQAVATATQNLNLKIFV